MANNDVRLAAAGAGVKLWELAEELGFSCDSSFSRKLRRELPAQEKERVFAAIKKLSREAKGGINE